MDDRIDDLMAELAREYNEPPEPPRDAMWERIVAARVERAEEAQPADRAGRAELAEGTAEAEGSADKDVLRFRHARSIRRRFRPARPLRLAAGIAAVLALGIGLGRLTVKEGPPAAPPATVATAAPQVNQQAYRLVTTEHLSQSEAFLTLFRASVRGRGDERLASATARQLLANNRLLLDSPAGSDPRTRLLLQDLELVLAEIAQLSPRPTSHDLQLITEGLEEGGVITRLRTAVPAGSSPTRGAL